MSTCSPGISNKVISGPYFGFTRTEMNAEYDRYKAALQKSGSRLTGASISGQSFSYGPRGDWSLTQWAKEVQSGLAQVDPSFQTPSGQIVTRFTSC
jgi:hypothetical protein